MAVLRIIPAGDLALEKGDLVLLGRTAATRVLYLRQKIASRFKFFLKEWFLDQREGVPYYRDVFRKRPNIPLIRSLFLRVLRRTPGVLEVVKFSTVFDRETRELSFAFQALVTDGEVTVGPKDRDFIVAVAPST